MPSSRYIKMMERRYVLTYLPLCMLALHSGTNNGPKIQLWSRCCAHFFGTAVRKQKMAGSKNLTLVPLCPQRQSSWSASCDLSGAKNGNFPQGATSIVVGDGAIPLSKVEENVLLVSAAPTPEDVRQPISLSMQSPP